MTSNKKKVAVVALVVCLVAILSLGSLAWFTASDSVDNELKFVTDFEMDLYEHGVDFDAETYTWSLNDDEVAKGEETLGNTYENIVPNAYLPKDPTVINKSSVEPQWIRMSVTVNNVTGWSAIIEEGADLSDIFSGFKAGDWKLASKEAKGDSLTYTYYLKEPLQPGDTATLFTGIQIPKDISVEQAADIADTIVSVSADAIQYNGLGVTAPEDAFAKF